MLFYLQPHIQGPVQYDENGTIVYTRIRLSQYREEKGKYICLIIPTGTVEHNCFVKYIFLSPVVAHA